MENLEQMKTIANPEENDTIVKETFAYGGLQYGDKQKSATLLV